MPGSFWLRRQGVDRRDRRIPHHHAPQTHAAVKEHCAVSGQKWKRRDPSRLAPETVGNLPHKLLLLRPTGWRNDVVHAQIFHHLAVMIEGMADRANSKPEPRDLVGSKWALNLSENIVLVDAVHCLVQIGERSEEHTSELQSLRHLV